MIFVWGFLIFWLGIIVGFLIRSWMNYKFEHYSGALVMIEEEDRKVYSLELFEDVDNLEQYHSVRFKVIIPGENLDRDGNIAYNET